METRQLEAHGLHIRLGWTIAVVIALLTALSAAHAENQMLTDRTITSAVTEELLEDHAVDGYRITATTQNGIVTLTGTTSNIMAKERAARLAETVRGVRSVVDRIEVRAPLRNDNEIEEDVEDALLFDRATESFEIGVTVNDQTVTLDGDVDSWQEKQLAAKVAKGVRGVKALKNRLAVNYPTDRADDEIQAEVQEALRWDALVDDALITVGVKDSKVELSGTVGSAAEKRIARTNAWVTGVTDVDASKLEVARWARDGDLRKNKYLDKSDSELEEAVEDAMLYDPRVYSFEVTAEADDGVVTLTGTVDNVKAKRSAAQNARNTVGVWRVKNHIKVVASTPSDSRIEQNIEDAMVRDPIVDRYEIAVTVIDGEAYLSGTVDTYAEKAEADDIAARTYGVTEVNNNLVVDDVYDPLTYDPYVSDDYIYDYDWYTRPSITTTATDWEIREDINDEMWWSPFVDSDEVTVTVEDGVARLTGTVDTWDERSAATENAFEGGAVAVDNDLTVDYGPDYYND